MELLDAFDLRQQYEGLIRAVKVRLQIPRL